MRIDFYLNAKEPLVVACRLASKAWRESYPCHIVASPEQLIVLDTLLWQLPKDAFLPHVIWEEGELEDPLPPVTLSHGPVFPYARVLINLLADMTPPEPAVLRLLEVVGQGAEEKNKARQRFRHYRSLYGPPNVYDLEKTHGTVKDL
jgi:DNA polymerase IIIc chi subunit